MREAVSLDAPRRDCRLMRRLWARVVAYAPARLEAGLAALSAILLVLALPDFDLWPLALVALVPLFFSCVLWSVVSSRVFVRGCAAC